MKKIFILLLIVLSIFSLNAANAQFSMGMQLGASNKNLIAGLHSQYQFSNRFTVGLNMTSHLDNSNPAFIQSRFGYAMGNPEGLTIQPYIGYSYILHGQEKNMQNSQFTEGIQVRYYLRNNAKIYTDFNIPASGYYMFSIGITGRL
jgi:hypothetical protein